MTDISRRSMIAGSASIATLVAFASTLEASNASAALVRGQAVQSSRGVFTPGSYIGQGTIFTRSVANMPLDDNSEEMAKTMATMPTYYAGKKGYSVTTGANTTSYNLPIYVVDSTAPNCPHVYIKTVANADEQPVMTGNIPCPENFKVAGGGDESFAIYDVGTGIMREYYHVEKVDDVWTAANGGYSQNNPGLTDLAKTNWAMQLISFPLPDGRKEIGTSAVVGMNNSASQIGRDEMRSGQINHAISFTMADGSAKMNADGTYQDASDWSWPAQQGDGGWKGPTRAPAEGQWCRIDPKADLDSMGLTPMVLMIAKAMQRYGAYGADHNMFCHAFNFESPYGELPEDGDMWTDINTAMGYSGNGNPFVDDFPWELTQWAEKDWKGAEQAAKLPDPWMYKASEWKFSSFGNFDKTPTSEMRDLALPSTSAASAGKTGAVMYTKNFNLAQDTQVSAPCYAWPRGSREQVVTLWVDGVKKSQVSTFHWDNGKCALKTTIPAGKHTVRVQFAIQPGTNALDEIRVAPLNPVYTD